LVITIDNVGKMHIRNWILVCPIYPIAGREDGSVAANRDKHILSVSDSSEVVRIAGDLQAPIRSIG
jgi:hypothetical protein